MHWLLVYLHPPSLHLWTLQYPETPPSAHSTLPAHAPCPCPCPWLGAAPAKLGPAACSLVPEPLSLPLPPLPRLGAVAMGSINSSMPAVAAMAASSSMPAFPACTASPTLPDAALAATSSMLCSSSSLSLSLSQRLHFGAL
eukprot:1150927-Pelagomonas_calceolata.AAC.4